MDVKHRLTSVTIRVEHCAESLVGDPLVFCDGSRSPDQLADDLIVRRLKLVQRLDVSLWNDEDVGRRLGVDVVESKHVLVFVDDGGRDFAVDDSAEQTRRHFGNYNPVIPDWR